MQGKNQARIISKKSWFSNFEIQEICRERYELELLTEI